MVRSKLIVRTILMLIVTAIILLAVSSVNTQQSPLSLSHDGITLINGQSNYPELTESDNPPSGIPWTWTASGFSGFSPLANIWFTYENDGAGQPNENHTEAYLHWSGFLDSEWENGNSGSFALTLSNGVDTDRNYSVLLTLRCLVADGYTVIKQQSSGGAMINDAGEEGFVFTASGFSGIVPTPTVAFDSMGAVTSCSCFGLWNQAGKFTLTIQDGTRPESVITGMNLTLGQLDSTIFTIVRNQQAKAHIINNDPADGAYHWSGNASSDFRTVDGQPPTILFTYDGGDTRRGIINISGVHDDDWAEEVSGLFTLSIRDGNRPDSKISAVLSLARLHDVAVTDVELTKTVVGQGYACSINVTVTNQGSGDENFEVTVYANAQVIGTLASGTMPKGTTRTLVLVWETTGFAYGNYTISAYAEPVLGETDFDDNSCTDGWVVVTWLGDLTDNDHLTPPDGVPDGVVDENDLWYFCGAFIDYYKIPKRLDANCDFNNDGKIDEDDLWTFCGAFIDYWKQH